MYRFAPALSLLLALVGCAGANTSRPVEVLRRRPPSLEIGGVMDEPIRLAALCLPRTHAAVTVNGWFEGSSGWFRVEGIESEAPIDPAMRVCVMDAFASAYVEPFTFARVRVTRTVGPYELADRPRSSSESEPADATSGAIDPAAVAREIRLRLGTLRDCYEAQLRSFPTLWGRVTVHFTIESNGRATSVSASSTLQNGSPESFRELRRCMADAFRAIEFPRPEGGSVDFNFPFNFSPSGETRQTETPDSPRWAPLDPPQTPTPLPIPGTMSGVLDTSDPRGNDGSLFDDYALALTAGEAITIVVRGGPSATDPSRSLDPFVFLVHDGVDVTHDDDSAGNLNSRIVFTPTVSGTYLLRVSTYGHGTRIGAYSIETWRGAVNDAR